MNTKERVIQYLLSEKREYDKNKLFIRVSRKSFSGSKISDIGEKEFLHQLSILETEEFIKVNFFTGHKDLNYYITIDLHASILNYFNNKKSQSKSNRREWVRTYLPITISTIALLKSFQNEILFIIDEVLKLIGQLSK